MARALRVVASFAGGINSFIFHSGMTLKHLTYSTTSDHDSSHSTKLERRHCQRPEPPSGREFVEPYLSAYQEKKVHETKEGKQHPRKLKVLRSLVPTLRNSQPLHELTVRIDLSVWYPNIELPSRLQQ